MKNQATIQFENTRIGTADLPILTNFSWQVSAGECWVITGSNGSGKSALASVLAGTIEAGPVSTWHSQWADSTALVSFEGQRDLLFHERACDDSDFIEGGVDHGTTARKFILDGLAAPTSESRITSDFVQLSRGLGIEPLLERGIKYLSTGEIRKVLLCRQLLRHPKLLILDEIYEGLDTAARHTLATWIDTLVASGNTQVILVADRYEALPTGASHVLWLENRAVRFVGTRAEFETTPLTEYRTLQSHGKTEAELSHELEGMLGSSNGAASGEILVDMRAVTVGWDNQLVLENLTWQVKKGEHWLVRGPNGCGKTTLLRLITGDNPQVYANDVQVLGYQRGSGESIWDIKARIGYVSYQLHLEYLYQCSATLEEAIISGFYDTIGLFENAGFSEILAAQRWLEVLGMSKQRQTPFTNLSYGEQRAALIARAAIKSPALLILDEPCHGLDPAHRHLVTDIARFIGSHTDTTILHVTHDPAEVLDCTQFSIEFVANPDAGIINNNGNAAPRFLPVFATSTKSINL